MWGYGIFGGGGGGEGQGIAEIRDIFLNRNALRTYDSVCFFP